MADFSFVTGRLATGGAVSSQADVSELKQAGITHCIDLRAEADARPLFAGSGLDCAWNGVSDDGLPKPPEWFAGILEFALPALARPRVKVLAFCGAGASRGPSAAYAILRALGLPPDLAAGMITAGRPQAGITYRPYADAAVTALGYGGQP